MGFSNNIPTLKSELPHGVYECSIDNHYVLKDKDGYEILYLGKPIVVIAFKNLGLISEKAFRLADHFEEKALSKLKAIVGEEINKKKLVVIIQRSTSRSTGKFEDKIVNFKPRGKDYSHQVTEVYVD